MSIELVIDNREQELIKKIDNSHSILIEQLEIGDILFRKNGETILVIERKTVDDLKSSICDGRFREQKSRLIGSTPIKRIMYLIEGSLDKPLSTKISGVPVSTLIGSIINIQLRDGIKVHKTNSINESFSFILKLHEKLEKDLDLFFHEEEQQITDVTYATNLKKSKKANMTPKVWFITQLCLIPQVTEKIAIIIVEKYQSIHNLLKEYEQTIENKREKLLSDLTFSLSNGKERRIGEKVSSRIYHFFYNSNNSFIII
jgi:crossover junction endonuclease MUS81